MSLEVNIGKRGNILGVGPENASQVCNCWFAFYIVDVIICAFVCVFLQGLHYSWAEFNVTFVQVILSGPVLNEGELEALMRDPCLKPQVLPTFFDIGNGLDSSLENSLKDLCEAADEAVRSGSQLLILSDHSEEFVRTFVFINNMYSLHFALFVVVLLCIIQMLYCLYIHFLLHLSVSFLILDICFSTF